MIRGTAPYRGSLGSHSSFSVIDRDYLFRSFFLESLGEAQYRTKPGVYFVKLDINGIINIGPADLDWCEICSDFGTTL